MKDNIDQFYATSRSKWRQWLRKNHTTTQAVWLICYKKSAGKPTIVWSDAVDEALCFGWIDSVRRTLDEDRFIQFFTKRKPSSPWSKINKDKVKRLISEGQMEKAGLMAIEIAMKNGSWSAMDAVEKLTIPRDLKKRFKERPEVAKAFTKLARSEQKRLLYWISTAKMPGTRARRLEKLELDLKSSPK